MSANIKDKYLAFDFGLKRIGVAISDENKLIAFPRDYLINEKDVFDKIIDISKKENISKIIIGLPINFKSKETEITKKAKDFGNKLELLIKLKKLNIEILFYDERFTSSIAQDKMINSDYSRKKRREKGILDSLSAQIILQDYLDKEKRIKNVSG
ncbi:MAG: Holliday junction resolvase RuvX [Ignavibacteria bacterium]|nr:Holliday junction resolvase RuvX [Ignavibacteria bacterium]